MKIGVLCSGELGYSCLIHLFGNNFISFVFTDNKSAKTISFCNENHIECYVGNPRNGKAQQFIHGKSVNILISVNYLYIIEQDVISTATDLAYNIHGSLLPKYRGRTPHVWAIINGDTKTGVTAHVIDKGCDTGDIINQVEIPILARDTGQTLLVKYELAYVELIDKILSDFTNGSLSFKTQDNSKATYFSKRTPEDGCISWDWHYFRLNNWVRAQSDPYPGAYTFYDGMKIIIDQISLTEIGFSDTMENGTIVGFDVGKPLIKIPNAVIRIEKIRGDKPILQINKLLNDGI